MENKNYVTYEDFGAVGDGVTDDFGAMLKAHNYANENGLAVLGTPGKNYYIFDTTLGTDKVYSIEIMTDVDWQGATITIDDRKLSTISGSEYYALAKRHVFDVVPSPECRKFCITDPDELSRIVGDGIGRKTKKIDLGIDWDDRIMIAPYYSGHKVYRRRGYGQFAGMDTHEIIVVEPDGTVSDETPIIFEYKKFDRVDVYKLDKKGAVTIKNGNFVTLDTRINHMVDGKYRASYIFRGIDVMRSYTTLLNLTHRVEGAFTFADRLNGIEGSITTGFFCVDFTSNVTFKNCIIPARMSFTGSSTYNFHANCANKIVLDHCVQSNFWITLDPVTYEIKNATEIDPNARGMAKKSDPNAILGINAYIVDGKRHNLFYGFCGTNYCKNLEYINSTLSRMDAHQGLFYGKVVNCNISDLELTGYGRFLVEDTNFYQGVVVGAPEPLLYLRADYGHTWEGEIDLINVNVYTIPGVKMRVAHHSHGNWFFGYTCYFPNITFDNVSFFDIVTEEPQPEGYEVNLMLFRKDAECMHLSDAKKPMILGVVDEDGDGYIDEPLIDVNRDGIIDELDRVDLDGDGRIGNTSLKYEDYVNHPEYGRRGVPHPTCTANVNYVTPPKYVKVVNNVNPDGTVKCCYALKDTSLEGLSDGGWYRGADEPDTMGGFFGKTEFIYDGGSFVGTDKDQTVTKSFRFKEEYDY